MRVTYLNVILFILPFALFFLYAWLANRSRDAQGVARLKTPWFLLILLALVLGISGFAVAWFLTPKAQGVYVPTRYEDGQVTPGRFQPSQPPPQPKPAQPQPAQPAPQPQPAQPAP